MKQTNLFIISAASLALLLAAACQKQEASTEILPQENSIDNPVLIKAVIDEDETKATITNSGAFGWVAGVDDVAYHTTEGYFISGKADATAATANFAVDGSKTRDYFAVFPSTIVVAEKYGQSGESFDVTLPSSYTLTEVSGNNTPCPMIADNDNIVDNWSFKQLCGLLRLTVNSIPPSATKITVNFHGNKVHGTFSIPSPVTAGVSSIATTTGAGNDVITITFDAAGVWRDGVNINLPLPTGSYTNVTVKALAGSTELLSVTRPVKIGAASYDVDRAAGKKCTASLPAFSVSDSKRVVIAASNLQFTRNTTETAWTDGKWSFMAYPWSIVESEGEGSIGENYAAETAIGLFSWGTSGYNSWGDGLYGNKVEPWNTSIESPALNTAYGPKGYGDSYDLTGTYANGDWGVVARTDLADGYAWRTPSSPEYMYLLGRNYSEPAASVQSNSSGSEKPSSHVRYRMFGSGKVNGVYGCIILPDYFVDPKTSHRSGGEDHDNSAFYKGLRFRRDNDNNEGVNKNTANHYTESEWAAMAACGAVFLPAAGWRVGSSSASSCNTVALVGALVNYQTVTSCEYYSDEAHSMQLLYDNSQRVYSLRRSYGHAVRLIRDIE